MFVNFSNHASIKWEREQLEAAGKWGDIIDIPFPAVRVDASENEIVSMADEYSRRILTLSPEVVMCQGEFTLCYAVVRRLRARGITVVAACSERMVKEQIDEAGGQIKTVVFRFERFREYKE